MLHEMVFKYRKQAHPLQPYWEGPLRSRLCAERLPYWFPEVASAQCILVSISSEYVEGALEAKLCYGSAALLRRFNEVAYTREVLCWITHRMLEDYLPNDVIHWVTVEVLK